MVKLLRSRGYGPDRMRWVFDPGAVHHESAWRRRAPRRSRSCSADRTCANEHVRSCTFFGHARKTSRSDAPWLSGSPRTSAG
ncbi:hypothetical protein [Nannocystis pusilla]|uniref:hypothetical protein n=1 Tax=Nannocystis pusilla TaxID=889268 RepID=UPI003B81C400